MKHYLHDSISSNARIPARQLAEGFRHSLDSTYERILGAARLRWERKFAGKEASDACVTVRISTGTVFNRFEPARVRYASLAA